jgi:RecA-family ATPase
MSNILYPVERQAFLKWGEKILRDKQKEFSTVFYKSHYNFWNVINGPRPGSTHLFIGPAGCGKSTLTISNTLLWAKRYKVLLILSEEFFEPYINNYIDVKEKIHFDPFMEDHFVLDKSLLPTSEEIINNILPISERDSDLDNVEDFEKGVDNAISKHQPDLIVYDNFTTGIYSEYDLSKQKRGVKFFSRLARDYHRPVIILAHTSKNVPTSNHFFNMTSVEGTNTLVKNADFLATFVKMKSEAGVRQCLTVEKHRGFAPSGNQINYMMQFHKFGKSGFFINDMPLSYSRMEELKKSVK